MSKLGDHYFEQAGKLPDENPTCSILIEICGICDACEDDLEQVIPDLQERVSRYQRLVESTKRTEFLKARFRVFITVLEQTIKELQEGVSHV